ncbi:hypothetical protein [Singulisphaera acidiphila]|uniref:Uncharacterized protein n=1 Tax=Singulisphaera acidiphila (strain ATCC BAA-1392 / DSM 18658 / VKM B-2454 / MOB10) TaxID=886293 RepID=L0D7W2_SINAD|nr:hypothetical protein [Singulisphaera acidiphila]AGA25494.1 hypothetical protein Sinac_1098 [Singulisphaera acidiphila DSM 18658]
MSDPIDDENQPAASNRSKRERSTRYPGVSLAESLKLCESIDGLGLDGLTASAIASALGYKNIKTNTFSARLSAARQFGLLTLTGDGYGLTPLARTILHPVEPTEVPQLHRQALLKPPLYAELAERMAGKRVPDPEILGNVLYHNHQIIATAKKQAAEAFLESARFAGALGADNIFHPNGPPAPLPAPPPLAVAPAPASAPPLPRPAPAEVRIDLQLWDEDEGKLIRVRSPRTISAASFERLLQTFRLLVRIKD